jgi:hypothetical protein
MIGVSTAVPANETRWACWIESVTRGGPAEMAGMKKATGWSRSTTSTSPCQPTLESPTWMASRIAASFANSRSRKPATRSSCVYRDGNTRTVRVKTVAAEELNKETFAVRSGSFSRMADRAALGISLGGNGSRRDTLGVLVVGVANDGPAAKAGIDEGDRVVAINGVDLRVATEDAGDGQASSARINRLNREMEKVKAGDAVELRVYSAGQVKTVRVESVKASEIEGGGFFFDGGAFGKIRSMTVPRAGTVRVRPPTVEFDELPAKAAEVDLEARSAPATFERAPEAEAQAPRASLSRRRSQEGHDRAEAEHRVTLPPRPAVGQRIGPAAGLVSGREAK